MAFGENQIPTPKFKFDGMSSPGMAISGKPHVPTSGTNWPSVVVAHGSVGMEDRLGKIGEFGKLIENFCQVLAAAGILAFAPPIF